MKRPWRLLILLVIDWKLKMLPTRLVSLAIILAILCGGCAESRETSEVSIESSALMSEVELDQALLREVARAVAQKKSQSEIEAAVRVKSVINTLREGERRQIGLVFLEPDPEFPDCTPPTGIGARVVYWVRPVHTIPPKIVGVYWDNSNRPTLFYALGYPR